MKSGRQVAGIPSESAAFKCGTLNTSVGTWILNKSCVVNWIEGNNRAPR